MAGLGLTATPGSRWPLGLSLSLCDQETEGRGPRTAVPALWEGVGGLPLWAGPTPPDSPAR